MVSTRRISALFSARFLVIVLILAITGILIIPSANTLAGSGSARNILNGFIQVDTSYGSTEINSTTSRINYVYLTALLRGWRLSGRVCATIAIVSDEQTVYESGPWTCRDYSSGLDAMEQSFYVYQYSTTPVYVHNGHSDIKVAFHNSFNGFVTCEPDPDPVAFWALDYEPPFKPGDVNEGSCGVEEISLPVVGSGTPSTSAPTPTTAPIPTATPGGPSLPTVPPINGGIQVVNISSHTVTPGESFNPSITVKRTDGSLATSAYLHAVPNTAANTFGAHDQQGVHYPVSARSNYTFQYPEHELFRMTAPQQTGTYQSVWRMNVGGVDVGPNIVIPITVQTYTPQHPIDYWDMDVYTSKDLSGSVAYHTTTTDQYLFRDWGNGSPAGNVPVDNWSARFVREINFPGGDYHFHCQHDDGCRILIDGTTKLDAWWDSSFDGHDWTGTLTPGYHEVKVEFYDQGGGAHMDMWWQGPGFMPALTSCTSDQWCADFWGNKSLQGYPPLTKNVGTTTFLDTGWGTGGVGYNLPADYFSARFTRIVPLTCGTYRFHLEVDDGVRFYVDGVLKLDEWHNKTSDYYDVDVPLRDGNHILTVNYFEASGETTARLSWDKIMFCASYSGDLVVSAGQTVFANTVQTWVTASGTTATVGSSDEFYLGDEVLFHQTQGSANVGKWEQAVITAMNGTSWTLDHSLTNAYSSSGAHAQVIKVPQYTSVTVQSGGTLTALPWNGSTGGILVFRSDGTVTIDGSVDMSGKGYRGGRSTSSSGREGQQGEGYLNPGSNAWDNRPANTNGGGGGSRTSQSSVSSGGGGGGAYGTAGLAGWNINNSGLFGNGGAVVGTADLSTILFGGGGGQGGNDNGYYGGSGGGAILIYANQLNVSGSVVSNGAGQGTNSVSNQDGNGGGGAGGAILLNANTISIGTNRVTASGGPASSGGVGPSGAGGSGRIRIEYCTSLSGSTNPGANAAQVCSGGTPTPTNTPTPTQAPSTTTFAPTDDTYAESATPSTALGSDPYLNIDASPQEVGYLKFNLGSLSGANVSSAKLRIYVANASADTQQIHETSTSWNEGSLTWNNKPALDSAVVGTISTGGTANVWKEVDITASVQAHVGGLYAIGIDTAGGDGLGFPSSENSSNQVQLVVNYTAGPTPTATPTPVNTPTPTATPATTSFSPSDDTYAESATPGTALGSDTYLNIDADPAEIAYLKFNLTSLAGKTVTSAKLRFYVANASGNSQSIHETSTSWGEGTLTWNNKPALDSAVVGTISTGGTANVWYEVPITASVQAHVGGLYAIGIDTSGSDGLGFPSSENGSNPVVLVVTYT